MLVPGLKNESLSTMISGDNPDYASVHKSLRECAQEMLDKYKQKPVGSDKLVHSFN